MKNFSGILLLLSILIAFVGIYQRYEAYLGTTIVQPIRADAAQYYYYAQNMALWGVYSLQAEATKEKPVSDALRTPGFPVFALMFVGATPEETLNSTLLAQTILQIVVFLLLSLFFIQRLGWWSLPANFILWTYPHFISINTYFLSESLFTSFLGLLLLSFWWLFNTKKQVYLIAVTVGLVLGFAILIRPVLEYFPWFLLLLTFLFVPVVYKKPLFIVIGVAIVATFSWKIRNWFAIGSLSDVTLTMNALHHGSFPNFMYDNRPETFGYPYRFDPDAEKIYEGTLTTLGLIFDRAIQAPMEYIQWYMVGKQFYFWQWSIVQGQGDIFIYTASESPYFSNSMMVLTHKLHKSIHIFWLWLGFAGAVAVLKLWFDRAKTVDIWWFFIVGMLVYVMLFHALIAPFPRYGIPFKLLLIPLCAYFLRLCCLKWLNRSAAT